MPARTHRKKLKPLELALFLLPVVVLIGLFFYARWKKSVDRAAMLNTSFPGLSVTTYSNSYNALAYSPDGRVLATGTMRGDLQWWDARSGALMKTLSLGGNDRDWTLKVAFSPDGKLFAANLRHVVLLYDGHTGKYLRVLCGAQTELSDLAFSPDSKTLAAGSSPPFDYTGLNKKPNGGIALWKMPGAL